VSSLRASRGVALLETVVAVAIMATAVVSLAGLAGLAIRINAGARERTVCTALAMQKLEQLLGTPAELAPSPPDALERDTPGYVDDVGADGEPPNRDSRRAIFVRRWAIAEWPGDPDLLVLKVIVSPFHAGGKASLAPGAPVARLVTIRSRRAW
jgi:hypothetical protein